jgi:hypothetical protein
MAIPQPEPRDWQATNAQQLRLSDAEILQMLRDAYQRVNAELERLGTGKDITRAQLEQTRLRLLAQQASVFERMGDLVSARRLRAASRAAKLSAASQAALLDAAGQSSLAEDLYRSLLQTSQRAIEAALARMGFSAVPLAQRIYRTQVWMDGRLNRLINATLAGGINAQKFAKEARDWFNPNTPGGVRYAALRLARTEINNAFHAVTVQKAIDSPWTPNMSWHLSKSHPRKDECNAIAELNGGVYKSEDVPVRPHPQCMCYVVPEPIEEDAFVDNFLNGDYDDYLDKELEKEDARLTAEGVPTIPSQQKVAAVDSVRKLPDNTSRDRTPPVSALQKAKDGINPTGMSRALQDRVSNMMDTQNRFVKDQITRVKGVKVTKSKFKGPDAKAHAMCTHGTIHLAPDFESRGSIIEASMKRLPGALATQSVLGNGNGLDKTLAHEMGHAFLSMRAGDPGVLTGPQRERLRLALINVFALPDDRELLFLIQGVNKTILRKAVSNYATENVDELMAEIWADYTLNPNPSPQIQEIGKLLERFIAEGNSAAR